MVDLAAFEAVFLVRHGQTEWNALERRQGQLDSPLTAAGVQHAERAALRAVPLRVDGIFSSPLGRARTTATLIARRVGLDVEVIDDLRELHHGRMAGLSDAEIERDHPQVTAGRSRDKYRYRFPGGESYVDVDRRAERAMARISGFGVRRPLVVSHEMIGRMLMRHLLDLDPRTAMALSHPHEAIHRVRVQERRADRIDAGGTGPLWPPVEP